MLRNIRWTATFIAVFAAGQQAAEARLGIEACPYKDGADVRSHGVKAHPLAREAWLAGWQLDELGEPPMETTHEFAVIRPLSKTQVNVHDGQLTMHETVDEDTIEALQAYLDSDPMAHVAALVD